MICFLSFLHLANSECVRISCQDTYDPDYRCIEVTSTVKVGGCPAGMYCPSYTSVSSYNQSLDFLDTYCEQNPYQEPVDLCTDPSYFESQSVGEECCIDQNCASSKCSNLKCEGLSSGTSCSNSSACSPGLYCKNGLCSKALPGASQCEDDQECEIGYGCNNGFCTKLWSVKFTKSASDPKFCESNYAFGEHCDMIQIKLNRNKDLKEAFKCKLEDTCSYNSAAYGEVIYSSACLCSGIENSTTGYCGLFINQVEGMFEDLFKEMQYSESKCSGYLAHSSDPYVLWQCGSIKSNTYEKYVRTNKRNLHWSVYVSGVLDKCAETITIYDLSFEVILAVYGIFYFL